MDYDLKVSLLLEKSIALWDVIRSCERQGALDKDIKNETPNDVEAFLVAHAVHRLHRLQRHKGLIIPTENISGNLA